MSSFNQGVGLTCGGGVVVGGGVLVKSRTKGRNLGIDISTNIWKAAPHFQKQNISQQRGYLTHGRVLFASRSKVKLKVRYPEHVLGGAHTLS